MWCVRDYDIHRVLGLTIRGRLECGLCVAFRRWQTGVGRTVCLEFCWATSRLEYWAFRRAMSWLDGRGCYGRAVSW